MSKESRSIGVFFNQKSSLTIVTVLCTGVGVAVGIFASKYVKLTSNDASLKQNQSICETEASLIAENESLQHDYNNALTTAEILRAELEKLQSDISTLQVENALAKFNLREYDDLKVQYKTMHEEKRLVETGATENSDIPAKHLEIDSQNEELKNATAKLIIFEKQIERSNAAALKCEIELEQLSQDKTDLTRKYWAAMSDVAEYKKKLSIITIENAALEASRKRFPSEDKWENEGRDSLHSQDDLETALMQERASLTATLESHNHELQTEVHKLHLEKNELAGTQNAHMALLAQRDEEISTLKAQLTASSPTSELDAIKSELASAKEALEAACFEQQNLTQQLCESRHAINEQTKQEALHFIEKRELEVKLQAALQKAEQMELELTESKARSMSLQESYSAAQLELVFTKSQFSRQHSQKYSTEVAGGAVFSSTPSKKAGNATRVANGDVGDQGDECDTMAAVPAIADSPCIDVNKVGVREAKLFFDGKVQKLKQSSRRLSSSKGSDDGDSVSTGGGGGGGEGRKSGRVEGGVRREQPRRSGKQPIDGTPIGDSFTVGDSVTAVGGVGSGETVEKRRSPKKRSPKKKATGGAAASEEQAAREAELRTALDSK